MGAIINGKHFTGGFMYNGHSVMQENPDGTWSQAIPEPFFVGFKLKKAQCDCGKVFKNREAYREHWQLEHTDGQKYNRTPQGMVEIATPKDGVKE